MPLAVGELHRQGDIVGHAFRAQIGIDAVLLARLAGCQIEPLPDAFCPLVECPDGAAAEPWLLQHTVLDEEQLGLLHARPP